MNSFRDRMQKSSELAGMRALLAEMPDDPLAKPLLRSRIEDFEAELGALDAAPATPSAELLFAGKPIYGSMGIDAKFAASVLSSFQNMLNNHHAASRHGSIGAQGRRLGEGESRLYLSALPRGSFGILLSQPQPEDFISATQVGEALEQITALVESAASGDAVFTEAVGNFHPRVLKPLNKFLYSLRTQDVSVTIRAGRKQSILDKDQVQNAYGRVSAAKSKTEEVTLSGIFKGVLLESWKFDFLPESGIPITGNLSKSVSEEQAKEMVKLFEKRSLASLSVTSIETRSGPSRPSYELRSLQALEG
jgi:hypothetical protein